MPIVLAHIGTGIIILANKNFCRPKHFFVILSNFRLLAATLFNFRCFFLVLNIDAYLNALQKELIILGNFVPGTIIFAM